MRISQAARYVGYSPATLRLWERQGLLGAQRTKSGYRLYGLTELSTLRRIAQLRSVEKLNAAGIRRALAAERTGGAGTRGGTGVGSRLRSIRKKRGLRLEDVARATDLSVSFLSSLEREQTGIAVSNLRRLLAFYRVTVGEILSPVRSHDGVSLTRGGRRSGSEGRFRGVRIEQLVGTPMLMEAQLFEVRPGAGSDEPYSHVGEEFIYVLSGRLDVQLESNRRISLHPGDCLYYQSSLRHSWRNPGRRSARLLWVNTPPTF